MASELLVLSFHIGSFPPVSFHLGMAASPTLTTRVAWRAFAACRVTCLQNCCQKYLLRLAQKYLNTSHIPSPLTSRGESSSPIIGADTIESWSAFFSREHQMRLLQLIDKSWTMMLLPKTHSLGAFNQGWEPLPGAKGGWWGLAGQKANQRPLTRKSPWGGDHSQLQYSYN